MVLIGLIIFVLFLFGLIAWKINQAIQHAKEPIRFAGSNPTRAASYNDLKKRGFSPGIMDNADILRGNGTVYILIDDPDTGKKKWCEILNFFEKE